MSMQDFHGAAEPLTAAGLSAACVKLGVEFAEIWTVLSVETKGCGFLPDGRPSILFERHIFSRQTSGKFDRDHPSISNPKPGGYGKTGAAQYYRLHEAIALDRQAALESTSWGIGQVMGFNAGVVGCANVETLVAQAMHSEDDQLMHMARFIVAGGIDKALRSHNWAAFARGYNGANYAANKYDLLLAQYFSRWTSGPTPSLQTRADQMRLIAKGLYHGEVDGIEGRFTRAALEDEAQSSA